MFSRLTPEADLLKGQKKFSLNPPCLKFLNAKLKEYKLGTCACYWRLTSRLIVVKESCFPEASSWWRRFLVTFKGLNY